jgi:hypothetical protein
MGLTPTGMVILRILSEGFPDGQIAGRLSVTNDRDGSHERISRRPRQLDRHGRPPRDIPPRPLRRPSPQRLPVPDQDERGMLALVTDPQLTSNAIPSQCQRGRTAHLLRRHSILPHPTHRWDGIAGERVLDGDSHTGEIPISSGRELIPRYRRRERRP